MIIYAFNMENWIEVLGLNTLFLGVPLIKIIIGIVIILIGLAFKKLGSKLITRFLHSFYKRKEVIDSLLNLQKLINRPLERFLFYIFVYIGYHQFDRIFLKVILLRRENVFTVSGMIKKGQVVTAQQLIEHALMFLILFNFVLLVTRFVDFLYLMSISKATVNKQKERQQILPLMKDVTKVVIWFFGIFLILGLVFKVDIGTIIAGLGIGGIALAFAAKDSLENLIASFMVLVDKPFLIGDWIKVDNIEGKVERIGFRSTRIRSVDRSLIIIPNKRLIDNKLENISAIGVRRVHFALKIQYGLKSKDILKLQEEIKEAITQTPYTTGIPLVYIDTLDANLMQLTVRYFIEMEIKTRPEYVQQNVNLRIYEVMNSYIKDFEYVDLNPESDKG